MKKLALYAAAAAITMSVSAPISAQAAVRMYVMNGNGCGGQGMNWSDIFSTFSQTKPSCGNSLPTVDILQPNLPSQGWKNPDVLYPNLNQDCWNQGSCPDWILNCPGQNNPGDIPDCPVETPDCPGQNWPGDIPSLPGIPDTPTIPGTPDQDRPSQGGTTNNSYVQEVISLVNEERAKAGLGALAESGNLAQAANVRAQEIVNSFSHTRPDGSSFSTVLSQNGVSYRGSGENIAYGQRTAAEVMDGWMNSSGHRANILNGNYTNIGVGFYESNGVKYWVQLFTY